MRADQADEGGHGRVPLKSSVSTDQPPADGRRRTSDHPPTAPFKCYAKRATFPHVQEQEQIPAASDEDPVQWARLVLMLGRIERLSKRLGGIPVSAARWRALQVVETFGPLTVGEFTRLDGHAPSSSTRQLRDLERDHLIERTDSPEDRRVSHLSITPEGSRTIRAFEQAVGQQVAAVVDRLPRSDRDAILAAAPALHDLQQMLRATHGFITEDTHDHDQHAPADDTRERDA